MAVYLGDVPVGVILSAGLGNFKYCNVEQIIIGNMCELIITESDTPTNYLVGALEHVEELSLYILEK